MKLVFTKLLDVAARAGFTVAATYLLAIEQAGQFGLINTLIGLAAFAFGWERHIDIQRRLVAAPAAAFDGSVRSMFDLWGLNYLLMLPVFLVAVALLAHIEAGLLVAVAVIAVCEQISNGAYNLAVVEKRYRRLMFGIAAKNLALLGGLGAMLLFSPHVFNLHYLLWLWAGFSAVGAGITLLLWLGLRSPELQKPAISIREQYRASMHHFLIGGLAVLSLQFDRLIVGAALPLGDVGLYFRHVVIVSLVYQFFNVASYNRRLPAIFHSARSDDKAKTLAIIRNEVLLVGGATLAGVAVALVVNAATNGTILARFELSITLGLLLLCGALIRVVADFLSLVLNARHEERRLFRNQLASFGAGSLCLVLLTYNFGLYGAAIAVILSMSLYLLFNLHAVLNLPRKFDS